MAVVDVTTDAWPTEVLAAQILTLVDVWAPWCVPCKRVEPMLIDLDERFGGTVRCVRLNADDAPELVAHYEVLTLPTLLLISGGSEVGRVVGVPKRDTLTALIQSHLSER